MPGAKTGTKPPERNEEKAAGADPRHQDTGAKPPEWTQCPRHRHDATGVEPRPRHRCKAAGTTFGWELGSPAMLKGEPSTATHSPGMNIDDWVSREKYSGHESPAGSKRTSSASSLCQPLTDVAKWHCLESNAILLQEVLQAAHGTAQQCQLQWLTQCRRLTKCTAPIIGWKTEWVHQ